LKCREVEQLEEGGYPRVVSESAVIGREAARSLVYKCLRHVITWNSIIIIHRTA